MKDRLSDLPDRPGVYLLKDERGRVIYVGKARNLRERLRSHFLGSHQEHPRLVALKKRIKDFQFITTESEVEALILEANLIKLHLPRYNVRLKDDKKYPYIKVTLNEDYPRVFPTRNLKRNGWVFFGPYTNVKSMRKALKVVVRQKSALVGIVLELSLQNQRRINEKSIPGRTCNFRLGLLRRISKGTTEFESAEGGHDPLPGACDDNCTVDLFQLHIVAVETARFLDFFGSIGQPAHGQTDGCRIS